MSSLFALADAGCSSFDAGGCGWPSQVGKPTLADLLGPASTSAAVGGPAAVSTWLYGGAEKVLGMFKRRYVQPCDGSSTAGVVHSQCLALVC